MSLKQKDPTLNSFYSRFYFFARASTSTVEFVLKMFVHYTYDLNKYSKISFRFEQMFSIFPRKSSWQNVLSGNFKFPKLVKCRRTTYEFSFISRESF